MAPGGNPERQARGVGSTWSTAAQAAIGIAFGAFVITRAVRLSLTYDEAASYIRYVAPHRFPDFDGGPLAVFNFEVATNHFLATVLTKLVAALTGPSELALRVPALAGYALYVWFSARLLQHHTSRIVAIAGLLLLNLNPYLLDFFGLSRGYGLSIGFMMGALYFLFTNQLPRMFVFATAAVLANFSMLNIYVGLVLLALGSRTQSHGGTTARPAARARSALLLFPVAAVFAALVFSQDPGLSASLYEPVGVRVYGLTAEQQRVVRISRVDLHGRVSALSDARLPVRAIRIEMPLSAAESDVRVETIIGGRAFTTGLRQAGAWTARDDGVTRGFESGPVLSNPRSRTREFERLINWSGDRTYAMAIARATGVALLGIALLAAGLMSIGAVAARARLVSADVWRQVSSGVLWIAALAGPPLYLLRRDQQLYFGGTRGLVQDTFYSLIDSSFYGATYHPNQTLIAFTVLLVAAAACGALALVARRRDAALVLVLMAIVSASLLVQHWLLGTVYLIGRTALLFVPLYLLFLIFSCDSLITRGRVGRIAGTSILVAAGALSAWHFTRTANLQYSLDWRDDADTKTMMADVEQLVAGPPEPRTAALGVEWNYAPVATYYARRHTPVDVDVLVAPYDRRVDFLYLAEKHAREGQILRRYPLAGTALARP